jgi:hypothetical protein
MLRESSAALNLVEPIELARPVEKVKGYTEPHWWNDNFKDVRNDRLKKVVKQFVTGSFKGKMKGYDNTNGLHIYSTKKDGTELWLFKNNPQIKVRICVAKKVGDYFIGNASGLSFNRMTDGSLSSLGGRLKIQQVLSEVMPMVPFQMFKDAKLDINSFRVVEKGPDETLDISVGARIDKRHYTGAMLFKIEVRSRSVGIEGHKDEYYLFDIDRNDLRLATFNAFLSKLPKPCKTIKEAYANLKPQEVYEAEKFLGHEVNRQGEWFFIPVQGEFKRSKVEPRFPGQQGNRRFAQAILQSKDNRPHYVEFLSEDGYVKGKVTHGGFEHKPIELETWCKAVPNTAIESFKISGAVD